MLATSLMSLALLTLAGILLDAHRREWAAAGDAQDEKAKRFALQRARRRLTATLTIALVGVLVALWPVTPRQPVWVLGYAGVLALLALQIFALGVWDAWASRRYYQEVYRRRLAEQGERLREAIEQHRSANASANESETAGA